MKNIIRIAVIASVVALVAAGCNSSKKESGTEAKNIGENILFLEDKRFADDQENSANHINGEWQNGNNLVGNHKVYRIEMSMDAANEVKKLNGINEAYVMLADRNAYVAVSFGEAEVNEKANKAESRTNISQLHAADIEKHRKMYMKETDEGKLTEAIKEQIVAAVKKSQLSVEKVYVSAKPEFAGRMKSYMTDVMLGHSIQSYVAEFNGLVDRIFPPEK